MTRTPSRRAALPRRLLLPALVVAAVTALAPTQAMAEADSVTITSPTPGTVLTLGDGATTLPPDGPVTITFVATGSPATCALDDQAPTPCASPFTFDHVTAGSHAVTVTAGAATDVSAFTLGFVIIGDPPRTHQAPGSVAARWRVEGQRTWVRRLKVTGLFRHSRVAVRCLGRGCPSRRTVSTVATRSVDLTSFLRGHTLRPGARIVVSVDRRGFGRSTFRYTIRWGASPFLFR
ncbi:hypothetical protein [Nocardioides pocheonensis]|uniref:Uncharacterized protein n=1 Tax=Nocardioides pocheonensis TaxID=661485 RepID=A0A3N0GUV5_9ACTN|nr:hypothetical protein [Nocardioides pocheonensis]RNM16237.1 hypothetical protein EFL26_05615 [Nocardioides pocheonensis]